VTVITSRDLAFRNRFVISCRLSRQRGAPPGATSLLGHLSRPCLTRAGREAGPSIKEANQ
jgi:hypothetical protein